MDVNDSAIDKAIAQLATDCNPNNGPETMRSLLQQRTQLVKAEAARLEAFAKVDVLSPLLQDPAPIWWQNRDLVRAVFGLAAFITFCVTLIIGYLILG